MHHIVRVSEHSRDCPEQVDRHTGAALPGARGRARNIERGEVAVASAQEAVRHDVRVCVVAHDLSQVVVRVSGSTTKRRAHGRRYCACGRSIELNEFGVVSAAVLVLFLLHGRPH